MCEICNETALYLPINFKKVCECTKANLNHSILFYSVPDTRKEETKRLEMKTRSLTELGKRF